MKYDDLDGKPRICPNCFGEDRTCSCNPHRIISQYNRTQRLDHRYEINEEIRFTCGNCGGNHPTSQCTNKIKEISYLGRDRHTNESFTNRLFCNNCSMFGHLSSGCPTKSYFPEKTNSGILGSSRGEEECSWTSLLKPIKMCPYQIDGIICTYGKPGEEPKPERASDISLSGEKSNRTSFELPIQNTLFQYLAPTRVCMAVFLYDQQKCYDGLPSEGKK